MNKNSKKKILITGATGFVGRHLVPAIDSKKYDIALVVRDKAKAMGLFGDSLTYIGFNDKDQGYKNKIKGFNPEIAIHLASYLTSKYDTDTLKKLLDSNISFGSMILDALFGTDIKYFINTGSFSEYYKGPEALDPAYLYSATKIAFRRILDFYKNLIGFKVAQIVPYSIYGPGNTEKKAIHYIIESIDSPQPFPMTEGKQVLDFIYITDVVDFYLDLLSKVETLKNDYNEYHLGTGTGTSIREVTFAIEEITSQKANVKWGALPYRPRDILRAVAPTSKTIADLGWKPKVSLRDGLRKMLDQIKKS